MCFDRIFPRRQGRPITFALPRLKSLDDVAEAAGDIVEGVGSGELTPNEAVDLFRVIDAYRRTLSGVSLAKKVAQRARARRRSPRAMPSGRQRRCHRIQHTQTHRLATATPVIHRFRGRLEPNYVSLIRAM
jgi:hypothetical protein